MLLITPFYVAILCLLYVGLSFNVIRYRRLFKQSLGSGGEDKLEKFIRMHGNFSEYVPLIIIMMGFLELMTGPTKTIHFFGVLLIIGRFSHAYGLSLKKAINPFRVIGMLFTFSSMIGLSIRLIVLVLQRGF